LLTLGTSKNWARDPEHKASAVAQVWREIFYNLEQCTDMPIQFRQLTNCGLEFSDDGGETWTPIFNAAMCVRDGIIEALDDGTLGGRGQPPGVPGPVPGECYTYYVTLNANSRWLSPMRVSEDDVITVSQVNGAWYDGALAGVGSWYCGDGSVFYLGACLGAGATDAGDPAPALNHMSLIGYIANETTPYFPMFDTFHTVGTTEQSEFWLQANDDPLNDNEGSLTFKVVICKDSGGDWPVLYDFATGEHHFVINGAPDYGVCGTYTGSSFESQPSCGSLTDALGVRIDWGYGVNITQIRVKGFFPNNINGGLREVNKLDGTFIAQLPNVDGAFDITINHTETLNGIVLFLSNGGSDVGRSYLYEVEINGTGLAPTP